MVTEHQACRARLRSIGSNRKAHCSADPRRRDCKECGITVPWASTLNMFYTSELPSCSEALTSEASRQTDRSCGAFPNSPTSGLATGHEESHFEFPGPSLPAAPWPTFPPTPGLGLDRLDHELDLASCNEARGHGRNSRKSSCRTKTCDGVAGEWQATR